eukprot:16344459-Heterocapsa_arctica.AAC.1
MEGGARMDRRTRTRNTTFHQREEGEQEQEHQEEAGHNDMQCRQAWKERKMKEAEAKRRK